MLIGREKELHALSEMYSSKNFRFLVMYGRRRVGKTSLLREFAKKKDVLYFSAQAKNDQLNLADFSNAVHLRFDKSDFGTFSDWEKAFAYIASKLGEKRVTIIIEETHHIFAEYPAIITLLQRIIDRALRTKNVFLILSDSDVSFVEHELLGYSSPLYGRITGQMLLMPLDYLDSSKFLPGYSVEDKLLAYGILGGTPCYAGQFDDSRSIADNIARSILRDGSFLNDEPQSLLRTQLRIPAVYNSILESVAGGTSRMNDISIRIHEESQKCAKYLSTLRDNLLIHKITPVGEDDYSRKSLYRISDNFFWFWYRFVFKGRSALDMQDPEASSQEILASERFKEYMGEVFKDVCREYMVRKAIAGKLPFNPTAIGRWWSGSSRRKKCNNIDLVALNRESGSVIFGKCRYDTAAMDEGDLDELTAGAKSFGKVIESHYYLFSKGGFSEELAAKAKKNKNVRLIGIEELYK